jgi:DNA-binding NtrC family response regulator
MAFDVVTEAIPPEGVVTQRKRPQRVARVLLADAALASRLALKAILSAAGYSVSAAATAAEALGKLDDREYQLVLADLRAESEEAGPRLLAYARQKEFHPATALIASDISETGSAARDGGSDQRTVHISNENVYYLLDRVAALISQRADRRSRRSLLKAS